MRVLSYQDLSAKGIKYSRQHIHRLVRRGLFPAPFKMSGGDNGSNSWFEHVIDQHIEACAAKQDTSKKTASSVVSGGAEFVSGGEPSGGGL
jgi:predicted DNA-binding transcriptional regulator AlpA